MPEDFPYVSFLRTMSEDGEEITKVLPVFARVRSVVVEDSNSGLGP